MRSRSRTRGNTHRGPLGTGTDLAAVAPSHPSGDGPAGSRPHADRTRRAVLRVGLGAAALAAPLLVPDARALAAPAGTPPRMPREIFHVGVLAPSRPDARALDAAKRRLERAVARPVAVRPFADGARLVDAVLSGRAHCAVHTVLTYLAADLVCGCALPVLRPVARDRTAGMRAVVAVRREGPVRSLEALDGRAVLGAGEGTVAGEVVRRGLPRGSMPIFPAARDALARFARGEGDALVLDEAVDASGEAVRPALARLPDAGAAYDVLWRSRPIWHGPVTLDASLPARLRERLTGEMAALRPGEPALTGLGLGRVRGFVPASREDYAPLAALLRG